jgi:hypothetical protein
VGIRKSMHAAMISSVRGENRAEHVIEKTERSLADHFLPMPGAPSPEVRSNVDV